MVWDDVLVRVHYSVLVRVHGAHFPPFCICFASLIPRNSVHDGDIAPMITALDVINDPHLPTTHILHHRRWRKSQVSPMGGRVILELLACEDTERREDPDRREDTEGREDSERKEDTPQPSKFIRLNINDGITALPDCRSGPGASCPLADFVARTQRKGREVGDFAEVCGLDVDVDRDDREEGGRGVRFLRQE